MYFFNMQNFQVDLKWEDILKEDCSKCIFDMDLEDGEENETESQKGGAEVCLSLHKPFGSCLLLCPLTYSRSIYQSLKF